MVRVLLVDDQPELRSAVATALGRHGRFEVVGEAGDGAAAVRVAATRRPDVALVDLAMPTMGGLDAIPGIRHVSPGTRVVVLSATPADEAAADALALGADAYLEKRTPMPELVDVLLGVTDASDDVVPRGPLDDFDSVARIRHGLLGPLTVVGGFATTLAQHADDLPGAAVADYAACIARNGRLLRVLIETVTDARLVELGSLVLSIDDVEVKAVVEEATADAAGILGTREVRLHAEPGLRVQGDVRRVRQVLFHLLANAGRVSPSTAAVDVDAERRPDGMVEIVVRDQGPGVPLELRPQLFGAHPPRGDVGAGLGLGLYVSRAVARAHGGDLTLLDTEAGASFSFVLPA